MSAGSQSGPAVPALANWQVQEIYRKVIEPTFGSDGPPLQTPRFVIVGGQQGSGKTTTIDEVQARLGAKSTQVLNVDALMPAVPGYLDAAKKDSAAAQNATGNTPGQWGWQLMERAMNNRHNVILELAPTQSMPELLQRAKMAGYTTEVHVLGVSHEKSWTSVVSRYEHGLSTHSNDPRMVSRDNHQAAYDLWPAALYSVERDKLADNVTIRDRDRQVLYHNTLVAGQGGQQRYDRPEGAMENLILARNAPLTDKDQNDLQKAWDTNVKSAALAKALPTQMQDFAADREMIVTYARSPESRFDPKDRKTHTVDGVSTWNERVTADTVNAYTSSSDRSVDFRNRINGMVDSIQKISERALHNAAEHRQQDIARSVPPSEQNSQTAAPARPAPSEQTPQEKNLNTGSRGRGSR